MSSDAVPRPTADGGPMASEPSEPEIDRMAAIDDYIGGFAGREVVDAVASPPEPAAFGSLLDALLLLRQSAAESGFVPVQPTIEMPERIGRYEVLRLAGEGGFAVVWEAFDPLLRRRVALKVRRPESLLSAATRRRFLREAEIASRLVHPHVVAIHEVGSDEGREFIAQEYCQGGSLADWLGRHPGPLPPRSAARLVLALARATAYAHASGVIHRDIKPANVLLVPTLPGEEAMLSAPGDAATEGGCTVKLADFGLGKLSDADSGDPLTQLTRTGSSLGTPAWMAPEQIDRSFGEIGPATDVHGLGLLLDRLLTGRALRSGGTTAETYRQVLIDEPIGADTAARGVPADLAAVCLKCLAKRPTDRYGSAVMLAEDLERWLEGRPTVARPLSPIARLSRAIGRRPMITALMMAVAAATVAAGWAGVERARETHRGASHREELRRKAAVTELRRGFETLQTGNVAAALAQLDTTRSIDPTLADSLAGRWLVRRAHNEIATLVAPEAVAGGSADSPKDLYSIVVSPDGRMAAVAAADGRLRLVWGLDAAPSSVAVDAHGEINAVCFSPDGKLLATAGQEGRLRWWRLDDTGPVAVGEAPLAPGPLFAVAFTSDARAIATGGEDRVVRLTPLDAPDACRELFRFDAPDGRNPDIESIARLDDSTLAASCGDLVVLLDVATGRVVREFELPEAGSRKAVIGSLCVSPDRRRIIGCGSDSKAHVWDVASGRITTSLPRHPAWVQGCGFSPDGLRVATACRDGGVRIFDAVSGAPSGRLVGHVGRVWSVVFEPSGTLLSAGADGTVRRWDPRLDFAAAAFREIPVEGNEIAHVEDLTPASSRPVARRIAAIETTGSLMRVDAATGRIESLSLLKDTRPFEMAADVDHRRLAVSWLPLQRLDIYDISGLDISGLEPAFSRLASTEKSDGDGRASIPLPSVVEPKGAIPCWTPQGELIVCSRAGKLCMLSADGARSGMIDAPLEDPVHRVALAPAGSRRLAASGRRTAIIPLPSGGGRTRPPVVLSIGEDSLAVGWSPDASLLACGTPTGRVLLFDAATGGARGHMVPHQSGVFATIFSSDGRILLTADSDCVRISDVETRTTLDEVRPGWFIRSVRLTADGDCLLIGGNVSGAAAGASARLAVMEFDRP